MSQQSSHQYDVLCIGSGISNLVAANIFAKSGFKVLIVEQHYKAGGYLHGFRRFGAHFDTGAHYIGSMKEGQGFRKLLEYLNAFDKSSFTELDPLGFDEIRFPDFRFATAHGYRQTIENLSAVFPRESSIIESYFGEIARVAELMPLYNLDERLDANHTLPYFEKTLDDVVAQLNPSHQLKCALYSYCVLHCVHPEDVPFAFHAVMLDSLIRGATALSQGGDALARNLVTAFKKQGGQIFLKTRISALHHDNNQITKAESFDGEIFSAKWIVSCLHPATTFSLISGTTPRKSFAERLRTTPESVGFLGVYSVHEHLNPGFAANKNYFAFTSDDLSGMEILRDPTKITSHSARGLYIVRNDRGFSKSGIHPFTIHAPAHYDQFRAWVQTPSGKRPLEYNALKNRLAEKLMEDAQQMFSDFGLRFEKFEVSTPLSNLHYNPSPEGSPYGIYHSRLTTGLRGFGPRTAYSNLILTGQSTMFPGLFASALSGVRSAGHILGITPLLKNIRLSSSGKYQEHERPKSNHNGNRSIFFARE